VEAVVRTFISACFVWLSRKCLEAAMWIDPESWDIPRDLDGE